VAPAPRSSTASSPERHYNPDFYWRQATKIYDTMRRNDGHVQAVLQMLELPIRSAAASRSFERCCAISIVPMFEAFKRSLADEFAWLDPEGED